MSPPDGGPLRAGIGLGSNLGDRTTYLREALGRLRPLHAGGPFLVSPIYETAPVDCPPGAGPFLNAVAELSWDGAAADLLRELLGIEAAMGRPVRRPRNAPRPIDLDLLYLGDRVIRAPDLLLPHPRIAGREFVLRPLADIRPDLVLPGIGRPVAELLRDLPPGDGGCRLFGRFDQNV